MRGSLNKDFQSKKDALSIISDAYGFELISEDENTGRLSFQKDYYRIDVYTSKMSVLVNKGNSDPQWYKRQTISLIEEMFINTNKY